MKKTLAFSLVLLGALALLAHRTGLPFAPPRPMLIAPMLYGGLISPQELKVLGLKSPDHKMDGIDISTLETAAPLVDKALNALSPIGKNGNYTLGYTLGIQMTALWVKDPEGHWVLDTPHIDYIARLIEAIGRPMVLYIMANHFDNDSSLARELAQNPVNLMKTQDGRIPISQYFGDDVTPWTLCTSPDIPINHYRYLGMDKVLRHLHGSPAWKYVEAVTLGGELHQMFPDFQTGTGRFVDARFTDYAQCSQDGFRKYLEQRFSSVERLNRMLGSDYPSFAQVPLPTRDGIKDKTVPVLQHQDAWATGILPVFGWVMAPSSYRVEVWVDGVLAAKATRGLNRMDVYEAVPEDREGDTGYRADLAFYTWQPGLHRIETLLVAPDNQTRWRLGERILRVMDAHGMGGNDAAPAALPADIPSWEGKGWMDAPSNELKIRFNPLAAVFDDFRASQVEAFQHQLYHIAREAGAEQDKLYSHQIVPEINGDWNLRLFSTNKSLQGHTPYHPGFNLYGSATRNPDILARFHDQDYGMPEFHPQLFKSGPSEFRRIIEDHRRNGARFVTPMFLPVLPANFMGNAEHEQFRLDDTNPRFGSSAFYKGLKLLLSPWGSPSDQQEAAVTLD